MQESRLPIEVCEHIMDLCWVGWTYTMFYSDVVDQAQLLACLAWVPCGRMNLYRIVILRSTRDAKASARTLRDASWLGALVEELLVGASRDYIPFAQGLFVTHLVNLHILHICELNWGVFPTRYLDLAQQFHLDVLELRNVPFRAEELALLWRMRGLKVCEISPVVNEKEMRRAERLLSFRHVTDLCQEMKTMTWFTVRNYRSPRR